MATIKDSCLTQNELQISPKAMSQMTRQWGIHQKDPSKPYLQAGDTVRVVAHYDDDYLVELKPSHFKQPDMNQKGIVGTLFELTNPYAFYNSEQAYVVANEGAQFFIRRNSMLTKVVNLQTGDLLNDKAAQILIEACLVD